MSHIDIHGMQFNFLMDSHTKNVLETKFGQTDAPTDRHKDRRKDGNKDFIAQPAVPVGDCLLVMRFLQTIWA